MFRGLPLTLWRSILIDLLALIAITAGVLVTIIAFAACVKPLSDGVLQAGDLLKFVLLAIPPMLAYALPFASGFASTLVYYRFAHENEAVAAHAGGISHRALVVPALVAALLVSGLHIGLNESLIPRFLKQMQRLITVDVARLIAQEVQKGKSITFKDLVIYADKALRVAPDPDSGASDQLILLNFAVIQLDAIGTPVAEATASSATLWLYPGRAEPDDDDGSKPGAEDGSTRVVIRLKNLVGVQQNQRLVRSTEVPLAWTVPNAFRDKTKYLSFGELRSLAHTPERMGGIDALRKDLALALAVGESLEEMKASLAESGELRFMDERGGPVVVQASGMKQDGAAWALSPPEGGLVQVRIMPVAGADGSPVTIFAGGATVASVAAPDQLTGRLDFRLDLARARVQEAGDTQVVQSLPERAQIPLTGLRLMESPASGLLQLGTWDLLGRADAKAARGPGNEAVAAAAGSLHNQLARLARQVLSKQNERLALAASCAVMILTGALTALKLTRHQPLTVYLWTFFPAIASIVTISGGDQITAQVGTPGLILMWSGVAGLGLYTLMVFRTLAKH